MLRTYYLRRYVDCYVRVVRSSIGRASSRHASERYSYVVRGGPEGVVVVESRSLCNTVRTTTLYYVESKIVDPPYLREVACFALRVMR